MTKDEALRLALEALEAKDGWGSSIREAKERAITAIKATLKAKDEPVEFFDWYDNAHWGNEDFKDGCHRAWNAAIKYTTPPQRKPLTDEQAMDAYFETPPFGTYKEAFIAGIRFIEAAHGIKEEA